MSLPEPESDCESESEFESDALTPCSGSLGSVGRWAGRCCAGAVRAAPGVVLADAGDAGPGVAGVALVEAESALECCKDNDSLRLEKPQQGSKLYTL